MLDAIRLIAERKISEAIRNGELENESSRNRPLPAAGDSLVPEDLRHRCSTFLLERSSKPAHAGSHDHRFRGLKVHRNRRGDAA